MRDLFAIYVFHEYKPENIQNIHKHITSYSWLDIEYS